MSDNKGLIGGIVEFFDGHRFVRAVIASIDHEEKKVTLRPLSGEPQSFIIATLYESAIASELIGFEFKRPIYVMHGNDLIH